MNINSGIVQLRNALVLLKSRSVNSRMSIDDFKGQQVGALKSSIGSLVDFLKKELPKRGINANAQFNLLEHSGSIEKKLAALDEISGLLAGLDEESAGLVLPQVCFPVDIRDEMLADFTELKKCFDAGCFRSAVVLCGRLLEVALHRKYFEIAGNDLLEKSPGLGLGNLLARMDEKGVKFDPGLTNQIHLINQVRIFSVHKKQQPFNPSKTQTQAIILYSVDVLKKLFK